MIDAETATIGTAIAIISGASAVIAAPIGIVASWIFGFTPWGPDKTREQLENNPEVQAIINQMVERKMQLEREKAERKLQREALSQTLGDPEITQEDA